MSEYMYGPEVAEKLAAPECQVTRGYRMAMHEVQEILKKFPEYRNHAPMMAFQDWSAFWLQKWIDEGKP